MANINMWEIHQMRISKDTVRERLGGIPNIEDILDLRRSKWLYKIGNMPMTDPSRRLIGSWHKNPRPDHRPKKTTRSSYIDTLKRLGFASRNGNFKEWIKYTRDNDAWEKRVETSLNLKEGTFFKNSGKII